MAPPMMNPTMIFRINLLRFCLPFGSGIRFRKGHIQGKYRAKKGQEGKEDKEDKEGKSNPKEPLKNC